MYSSIVFIFSGKNRDFIFFPLKLKTYKKIVIDEPDFSDQDGSFHDSNIRQKPSRKIF